MSAGALAVVVVLLLLGFFVIVRPQRRRAVEQAEMQDAIEPGDEVLTAGGIFGFVTAVGEDELRVEIAPGTTIRVARRAVAAIMPPDEEGEEASGEAAEEAAEAS